MRFKRLQTPACPSISVSKTNQSWVLKQHAIWQNGELIGEGIKFTETSYVGPTMDSLSASLFGATKLVAPTIDDMHVLGADKIIFRGYLKIGIA